MKIALVHHCNYGSKYMTDKSWWFQIPAIISDGVKEGNFVVTENKMQRTEANNLCISWVEKIKDNENENPTSIIVSNIINSGTVFFPKPILESEMGQEDDFDEESF